LSDKAHSSASTKKRLVLLVFLFLTPLLTLYFSHHIWKNELETLAHKNKTAAHLSAQNLAHNLEQHIITSRLLANSVQVLQLLRTRDESEIEQINTFLQQTSNSLGASVIYVLNLNGITIASSNWNQEGSFVGKNYAFRPYFKQAINGEEYAYVALGVTSGSLGYYHASPIKSAGQILGVVVVKTDLIDTENLFADLNNKLLVTDHQGVIILTTEPSWRFRTISALTESAKALITESRQYTGANLRPLTIRVSESNLSGITLVKVSAEQTAPSFNIIMGGDEYAKHQTTLEKQNWQLISFINTGSAYRVALLSALSIGLICVLVYLLIRYLLGYRENMFQLREQSIRDSLTGLYTRRYMNDAGAAIIARYEREIVNGFSTVMLDIDHFKTINDNYGHQAGDTVLQRISDVIQSSIRSEDLAVRYGGEEFVLILESNCPHADIDVVERIYSRIKALEFTGALRDVKVTISLGVARYRHGESFDDLIARADSLLYKAKQAGRDQVCSDMDDTPHDLIIPLRHNH